VEFYRSFVVFYGVPVEFYRAAFMLYAGVEFSQKRLKMAVLGCF
jgi:hypothetical protein